LKAGAICVAFLRISRSRPASIWGMEQVAMRRTAGNAVGGARRPCAFQCQCSHLAL